MTVSISSAFREESKEYLNEQCQRCRKLRRFPLVQLSEKKARDSERASPPLTTKSFHQFSFQRRKQVQFKVYWGYTKMVLFPLVQLSEKKARLYLGLSLSLVFPPNKGFHQFSFQRRKQVDSLQMGSRNPCNIVSISSAFREESKYKFETTSEYFNSSFPLVQLSEKKARGAKLFSTKLPHFEVSISSAFREESKSPLWNLCLLKGQRFPLVQLSEKKASF